MEHKRIELTPEEQRMVASVRAKASPVSPQRRMSGFTMKELEQIAKGSAPAGRDMDPTPLFILTGTVSAIQARFARDKESFESLFRENEELKREIAGLRSEMVKGVAGVRWAGTHEANREYRNGELVSRNGLWLCKVERTTTQPGTDPASWVLVVHRAKVKGDER